MKKLIAMLLALVMVLSLAACGGSEPAPAATEAPAAPAAPAAPEAPAEAPKSELGTKPVEIIFWHCASDDVAPLMDKYIADFKHLSVRETDAAELLKEYGIIEK